MRRTLIAAAICALTGLALVAGSAQAAGTNGGGLPSSGSVTLAKKPPKAVTYEWCEEVEPGNWDCEFTPFLVYKKSHTWEFEGFSNFGGVWEKSGKYTIFYYTEEFDTGSYLQVKKVKKNYFGYFYYWNGEEFVQYPVLKELRRA